MESIYDFKSHLKSTTETNSEIDGESNAFSINQKRYSLKQPEGQGLTVTVFTWTNKEGFESHSYLLKFWSKSEDIQIKVKSGSNDFSLFNSVLASKLS